MDTIASILGIELAVIQAPMLGVQDERLALAVAGAGGLGSIPCALFDARQLDQRLQQLSAHTALAAQSISLNFFCHAMAAPDPGQERRWQQALAPYYAEVGIAPTPADPAAVRRPIDAAIVEVIEQHRPRIVSFHFGLPQADLLQRIKRSGARVMASATTVDEGHWLAAQGADIVIAQGIEAGGHRGQFLPDTLRAPATTRVLVQQLAAALPLPIVAAGGIGSRDDVQALHEAGASAVQAGTAYLLCPEATTSATHRDALRAPHATTALTNLLTGRAARGLVNRLMRELGPMSDLPPAFPWAAQALAPLRAHAEAAGRGDFSPLWSGTRPGVFRDLDAAAVTRVLAGVG